MAKKYQSWGGRELSGFINGKFCGVKYDNGKAQTYYYRHPQISGLAKKVNLGSTRQTSQTYANNESVETFALRT